MVRHRDGSGQRAGLLLEEAIDGQSPRGSPGPGPRPVVLDRSRASARGPRGTRHAAAGATHRPPRWAASESCHVRVRRRSDARHRCAAPGGRRTAGAASARRMLRLSLPVTGRRRADRAGKAPGEVVRQKYVSRPSAWIPRTGEKREGARPVPRWPQGLMRRISARVAARRTRRPPT